MSNKKAKMQHCDFCGTELGVYFKQYGEIDTCSARECVNYARDQYIQERDEAHEQLDRDRGWS